MKLDHYKHLLDEVAPELVTVPIILHCMVEQVAVVDCGKKDMEALEAANQRKEARLLLEQAFLNLGKRMELPYHSPHGNIFLPPEFQYDEVFLFVGVGMRMLFLLISFPMTLMMVMMVARGISPIHLCYIVAYFQTNGTYRWRSPHHVNRVVHVIYTHSILMENLCLIEY